MPPQISKEVRQRIYELCGTKKPREILTILKLEDIDITERSIYNLKRENREAKTRNESFASFDEPFGGSFDEFCEEEAKRYQLIITQSVKEDTQQVLSMIKEDITERKDQLDEIMKETKKNFRPLLRSKISQVNASESSG